MRRKVGALFVLLVLHRISFCRSAPHAFRELILPLCSLKIGAATRNRARVIRFSPHQFLIRRIQMLAKYVAAAVAGSFLVTSAAFAAETSTTTPAPSTAASASESSSYKGDWRASKMVGLNVYNDKNENIGSISDLLMDKSGNIKAAVISVGGFLGVGARLVAVPYDKIKFSSEPVSTASNKGSNGTGGTAKSSGTTTGSTANKPASTSKPNPWYPDHAMFNASKDDLKKVTEFKYSE